jgi:GNAT superfamily N-acetyltransferase
VCGTLTQTREAGPDVHITTKRYHGSLDASLAHAIVALWNDEYPAQLRMSVEAFTAFVDRGGAVTHYVDAAGDSLLGWGMCFDRAGERWFSLIVARAAWGRGIGRRIVQAMQADERILCGWVIDHDRDHLASGERYTSPLGFYVKLGFDVQNDIRWEDDKISAVKIRWARSSSADYAPGRP